MALVKLGPLCVDVCLCVCSLMVQVQRQQGPGVLEDRDLIFERGSTTTYSSFRKGNYTKPWSIKGLKLFFLKLFLVSFLVVLSHLRLSHSVCVCCLRDGHVLPGHQYGGDGLLYDRPALSSPSQSGD